MKRRLLVTTAWAITGLLPELVASTALADDVRYYQEGGTTFRETRSTVRRPVTEMTMQPTTRTYYRDQTTTQLQDAYHTYYVPVTEYRRESYWQGRWNPFTQPTLAERWVTSTRWEMRVDRVQIPVAQRTLVPETRTEHVPVVTQRFVDDQIVSRVQVGGPNSTVPATSIASGQTTVGQSVGGVSRLDTPPRSGPNALPSSSNVPSTADWRPAQSTIVR